MGAAIALKQDTTNETKPAKVARKRKAKGIATSDPQTGAAIPTPDVHRLAARASGLEATIDLTTFRKAIAQVAPVCDRKSTLPILHRVALRATERGVVLAATDLSVSMTMELAARVDGLGGVCVEIDHLRDLAKIMPNGEVLVWNDSLSETRFASGNAKATLFTMPDRDFPKIASYDGPWATVPSDTLGDMIDETLFSVCLDETRFHLNGAFFEASQEKLSLTSTDGHRLSRAQRYVQTGLDVKGAIIPAKALREARRFLDDGDCEIAFTDRHVFIRQGGTTLSAKLIDAQYPPYEQVIPESHKRLVTVPRKAIVDALKRARVMCTETRGVELKVTPGQLLVKSDHPDRGTLVETIAVDYRGDVYAMGFNPIYLADACDRIDGDDVVLGMSDELDPGMVRSVDDATQRPVRGAQFLAIVMPMRI